MITITFPDKTKKEFKKGITGLEIAISIAEGLGRAAVAAKVNDELIDLNKPINKSSIVKIKKAKKSFGIVHHI